jgi:molybdenum cofactor biosynthesis enzyme MoaA
VQVCLFDNREVSLRDAMRGGATDAELQSVVSAALWKKKAAHAGLQQLVHSENRPMIRIGG